MVVYFERVFNVYAFLIFYCFGAVRSATGSWENASRCKNSCYSDSRKFNFRGPGLTLSKSGKKLIG